MGLLLFRLYKLGDVPLLSNWMLMTFQVSFSCLCSFLRSFSKGSDWSFVREGNCLWPYLRTLFTSSPFRETSAHERLQRLVMRSLRWSWVSPFRFGRQDAWGWSSSSSCFPSFLFYLQADAWKAVLMVFWTIWSIKSIGRPDGSMYVGTLYTLFLFFWRFFFIPFFAPDVFHPSRSSTDTPKAANTDMNKRMNNYDICSCSCAHYREQKFVLGSFGEPAHEAGVANTFHFHHPFLQLI